MSKKSVVGHWGHRRTDLHIDEAGDKFTINTVQDAEPIVEANKRRYNDYGDKLSVASAGSGTMQPLFHLIYGNSG